MRLARTQIAGTTSDGAAQPRGARREQREYEPAHCRWLVFTPFVSHPDRPLRGRRRTSR